MREPTWELLVNAAVERGIKLSTAESCTGGYIASSITDVPGASACYIGGAVVYSNELKTSLLGVGQETLMEHGAVSREAVEMMSEGCLGRIGGDLALAVTGIAGPAGGSDTKPVGTVFISVSCRKGPTLSEGFLLDGLSRMEFKKEVGKRALGMMMALIASERGSDGSLNR